MLNHFRWRNVFLFCLAISYAYVLANLPIDKYVDRNNYLDYIQDSSHIFYSYWSHSPLELVFNEPIWLAVNILVGFLFESEFGLQILIFFSAACFAFFAGKEIKFSDKYLFVSICFLVLLLLLPQVLKNYIVHLRQGFAISVFFVVAGQDKRLEKNLIASILASLVHSSFFFVSVIFAGLYVFRNSRIGPLKTIFLNSILVALLILFLDVVGGQFGARQISESDYFLEINILGFLFWLFMYLYILVCIIQGWIDSDSWTLQFVLSAVFLYLVAYYSSPFSGRIFETCLPLIIIQFSKFKSKPSIYLLIFLVPVFFYQWLPLFEGGDVFRLAS